MLKALIYRPVRLHQSKLIKCNHIHKLPLLRTKTIVRSNFLDTANTITYFVGKGVILFTMFYCTLNWYHYKKLNDEYEKDKKDKK